MEVQNGNVENNSTNTETQNTNVETQNTNVETKNENVENNSANVETKNENVENNSANIEDKTIPYNRFKEVNDNYKKLKEDFDAITEKLNNFDKEKEDLKTNIEAEKEALKQSLLKEQEEKRNIILESYKTEDKEYLDYLIKQEENKEENKDLDFKSILNKIREEKPQIFKNTSSPSIVPGGNNNTENEISVSEYNNLPKEKRQELLKKGVKVV